MAAEVGERPQFAIVAADNDHRSADGVERAKVARIGQHLGSTGEDPPPTQDVLHLKVEELR